MRKVEADYPVSIMGQTFTKTRNTQQSEDLLPQGKIHGFILEKLSKLTKLCYIDKQNEVILILIEYF